MNIAAIVCEYNPFHAGHAYQIAKTREAGSDVILCIMSGNFVQRGEPAVYEKRLRAKQALANGADLVVELPVLGALRSCLLYTSRCV